MADTTKTNTLAEIVKRLGGEGNTVAILLAYEKNQVARTEYNKNKNAVLKAAMQAMKEGKLVVPGVTPKP